MRGKQSIIFPATLKKSHICAEMGEGFIWQAATLFTYLFVIFLCPG